MLKVIICCDVDHDVLGYNIPATRFDVYKERLGWESIENISKIRETCDFVKDCESNSAKVTWFVRSDEQLKAVFDDYAYPLRNFSDLWKKLEQQGDEIGWHPHLWRWSKKNRSWYQEVSDNEWMNHCLEKGHREFVKLIKSVSSVRMGWGFHNNFTMKKVDELGVLVDLSASPDLKHEGGPDERGSHFLNEYDWSITTQKPYRPSKQDYRRSEKNNEQNLRILEIPITTVPKSMSRVFIEEALKLAPIDLRKRILRGADIQFKSVQHRYVANITESSFKHVAKQKFKEAKRNPEAHVNLVAIFHPIELFRQKRFKNLRNNLNAIKELSRRSNIPFSFLTATEIAERFLERAQPR